MKQWKKLTALALALVMTLALAACGAPAGSSPAPGNSTAPEESQAPAGPKTLAVGTMDATDTFDPCSNANCGLGLTMVYDTILKLNYETMEVEPSIATAWEWVEADLLKLTIRDDAVFSNGDPLTPEDVLYSLSRFVFENNQFDPGYDDIDYDNSYIEGNDLFLKLTTVSADFLYNLSNDRWASVVNEEYVKANPDSWWNAPCGSGPYVCDENVEGSHSSYTRRDDYWGELPDAETVTIRHYSEATTMIADFENGALDLALDVSEDDYLAAQDGAYGDVATKLFPKWDLLAVCLPEYNPVFDDIRVREAISLALDTKSIVSAVFGSLGEVAESILISGSSYYTPIGVHEYNPEKARQLLAEAGYGDGMTMKVVFPTMPTNDKCGTIVQAMLREVGIELTVESYDFATAIPILMANGTDISIFGTGGGTYLDSQVLDTLGQNSTNGGARVTDAEFNQHIEAARVATDDATRQAEYDAVQQWAFDNYRTLPIGYAQAAVLYHNHIGNVTGLNARSVDIVAVSVG